MVVNCYSNIFSMQHQQRLPEIFQVALDSDFKCNTIVPAVGTDSRIKHLAFRSQVFYSLPVVLLILNPAYLPITDVSEIGLFGEILSDESVGILIQIGRAHV